MKLGIIFNGVKYRGADCSYCRICGSPIRYQWTIWDSQIDQNIPLCEKHYKKWERKKEFALIELAEQFRRDIKDVGKVKITGGNNDE